MTRANYIHLLFSLNVFFPLQSVPETLAKHDQSNHRVQAIITCKRIKTKKTGSEEGTNILKSNPYMSMNYTVKTNLNK